MVGEIAETASSASKYESANGDSILPTLGIPSEPSSPATPLTAHTITRPRRETSPAPVAKGKSRREASPRDAEQEEFDEKYPPEDDSVADMQPGAADADDARSEIHDIMDQFSVHSESPDEEKIMSPIRERASFFTSSRGSIRSISPSLYRPTSRDSIGTGFGRSASIADGAAPSPPPDSEKPDANAPLSPTASGILHQRPPSPDPEPVLPFDFHRFLEQLRHKSADPVARFLRSFLNEFGKKQWAVHEQVKIISDFLEFIAKKMLQCEVWRTVSEAEFDNAKEGMEKLVMNRLYSQTFSPIIPPMEATPQSKSRRLRAQQPSNAPGRKGQHQEDVERDQVIAQKLRIYGWIREEHLDMAPLDDKGRKFLSLAQQELLKINSYRAPRDKVIQILNCCKVIFGFLKNNQTDQSADSFIPLLIFTVLRANPPHLASNVQYILRFRREDKLGGEAGYYISSLSGVISFIETLDRTNLTISDEEFERNVEAAVSTIAEGHRQEEYETRTSNLESLSTAPAATIASPLSPSPKEATPRASVETPPTSPRRSASRRFPSETKTSPTQASSDDLATGILRSIQRPLTNIGRMFSDPDSASGSGSVTPTALPVRTSSLEQPRSADGEVMRFFAGGRRPQPPLQTGPPLPSRDANVDIEEQARQASRADAEAQRVRSEEHRVVVETLQGMFPDLDRDVISDVVRMKEGRVGLAVDACLALSTYRQRSIASSYKSLPPPRHYRVSSTIMRTKIPPHEGDLVDMPYPPAWDPTTLPQPEVSSGWSCCTESEDEVASDVPVKSSSGDPTSTMADSAEDWSDDGDSVWETTAVPADAEPFEPNDFYGLCFSERLLCGSLPPAPLNPPPPPPLRNWPVVVASFKPAAGWDIDSSVCGDEQQSESHENDWEVACGRGYSAPPPPGNSDMSSDHASPTVAKDWYDSLWEWDDKRPLEDKDSMDTLAEDDASSILAAKQKLEAFKYGTWYFADDDAINGGSILAAKQKLEAVKNGTSYFADNDAINGGWGVYGFPYHDDRKGHDYFADDKASMKAFMMDGEVIAIFDKGKIVAVKGTTKPADDKPFTRATKFRWLPKIFRSCFT